MKKGNKFYVFEVLIKARFIPWATASKKAMQFKLDLSLNLKKNKC